MARGDLTDAQWETISPLLPVNGQGRGGWWKSHRKIVNGVRWRIRTGSPWRDVPRRRFGPWQTVYDRFNRWSKDGTWDRLLLALQEDDGAGGRHDDTLWCVDGSSVRAHVAAAGAKKRAVGHSDNQALGRSRGGFTTKFHMICDGLGNAITFVLSQGQRHDSAFFHDVLDAGLRSDPHAEDAHRRRPDKLAADKAYRAKHILDRLAEEQIEPIIPKKSNELRKSTDRAFDKASYRRRNVVERLIGWLKQWRGVATRYDKLARNYRAALTVALMERSLRRRA